MKVMKKLLTAFLVTVMVLGMGITAMAEEGTGAEASTTATGTSAQATGTITITPPEGVDKEVTYKVYKVFDATGDGKGESGKMSYRLVPGKTDVPKTGFALDAAGNVSYVGTSNAKELTPDVIEAIREYVANDTPVDIVTTKDKAAVTTSALPNGYYFITTSTGTAVTISSANPNAEVNDKNTVPTVDKKITGADQISTDGKKALAQVGTDVTYTATVNVGNGSKDLIFHDKMNAGLTFKGNDNVSIKVGDEVLDSKLYQIYSTPAQGDTITIKFDNSLASGTVIKITYVATINAEAVTKIENDAYLTYGDGYTSEHSKAEVYNAKISVIKKDGKDATKDNDDVALAGAGFVLKKSVNGATKYYQLTTAADGKLSVAWVDDIKDATEYKSDANGNVPAFVGLSNGEYWLEESTVPNGFNKAKDVKVTINGGDFKDDLGKLDHSETILNYQGSLLPTTGGIGTTIFYIVGAILVIAAVAYFILRRKSDAE